MDGVITKETNGLPLLANPQGGFYGQLCWCTPSSTPSHGLGRLRIMNLEEYLNHELRMSIAVKACS